MMHQTVEKKQFGQGSFYMRPLVISCCPLGFGWCVLPMAFQWGILLRNQSFPMDDFFASKMALMLGPIWPINGEYFISHIGCSCDWILDHWAELMKAGLNPVVFTWYLPSLVAQIPILRVCHLFWLNLYAFDGGILYGFIQRNCRGPAALEDLSRREPRRMAKHLKITGMNMIWIIWIMMFIYLIHMIHDFYHFYHKNMNHMNFVCQKIQCLRFIISEMFAGDPITFCDRHLRCTFLLLRCHWNIFVLHNLIACI